MSDDNDSNIRPPSFRRRSRRVLEDSFSDSSSEDDTSQIHPVEGRRAVLEDSSSSDESSSDSIINPVKKRRTLVFEDSWETESDTEMNATKISMAEAAIDSDSSDGQSDKCPICLISLKTQEIGTPEACDHMFCVECIQEWSKNMNTCPVDRQEYRVILVRQSVSGQIYKQISVDPPTVQEDESTIVEDPTFCEICGLSDREDTMLLCDGCDLGYHIQCLQPPLENVPSGNWYCSDCPPEDVVNREIELFEVQLLLDDANEMDSPMENRRRAHSRLVPRTRHSERVLRRIAENRNSRRSTTLGDGSAVSSTTLSSANTRHTRRKKRKIRYRTIYKIDETTGETITVKKRIKKKRKKKPRIQILQSSSGARRRLAAQLGICTPRNIQQNLPDVRVPAQVSNLQSQRFQAGIPTLSLFGPREDLNYFSQSEDEENSGGLGVARRRAPNRQDVAIMRRARLKTVNVPDVIVTSSSDILGSILKTQEQFHSKGTKFSLAENGKFTMQASDLRLDNYNKHIRRRPFSENSRSNDSIPSSSGHGNDYGTNLNSPEQSSVAPTSTVETNTSTNSLQSGSSQDFNTPQNYTQSNLCNIYDVSVDENKENAEKDETSENNTPRSGTPASESEIDIYSDIETVSTSKADDNDLKELSPVPSNQLPNAGSDEESIGSDNDMVIDTEKTNTEPEENAKEETAVSSTVDSNNEITNSLQAVTSSSEIQSQAIQSSNQLFGDKDKVVEDDEDSEDGCPNFSIYSKESINLAKNTDITLAPSDTDDQVEEVSSSPAVFYKKIEDIQPNNEDEVIAEVQQNDNREEVSVEEQFDEDIVSKRKFTSNSGLYSDSEDETIVKRGVENSFGISDIRNMTEDISEEERSYTPCLDERGSVFREGLEGLDTEMISDEERNDFDEAQELKTASDGDALEINAKESELDFTRPEDYEEGEIVDKSKQQTAEDPKQGKDDIKKPAKKKDETGNKTDNKENENNNSSNNNNSTNISNRESAFKKLSKNTKERNYRDKDRDKDRDRSKSREKKSRDNKREKRREKRKEIERYDVRALIAEKPRRLKDQFGRDIRRTPSRSATRTPSPKRSLSRNHRSLTPRRSASKQRSVSRGRARKKKARSSRKLSPSRSRSQSFTRRRSRSKTKKRPRTLSREQRKKSRERNRSKAKTKKRRSRSRHSRSPTPKRHKDWSRRQSREWTPSLSRSHTPEPRHLTPSWTPPRLMENTVNPRNLTVILTNNANKKKKEKKKKQDKRAKEPERPKKRRRSDRTPPPSKEVFASGDNILVSVSFNKDNETRDVSAKRRRNSEDATVKKPRKEKVKKNKKKNKELIGVKPVAIIDLERSPFKEITPSPKDVIVLSDSDNEENRNMQKTICDSSQLVTSPERLINSGYSTGPKTPPEPQVKFTLQSKQTQMRAISNPLHEPDEIEPEENTEELDDDAGHKGPNTPPEPPNSPPSSPDAYDPFEPTKSRSPTPEPIQAAQSNSAISLDDNLDDSIIENRCAIEIEKSSVINITPDNLKSHTPPLADVQPADSQSSMQATPDSSLGKSPDHISTGPMQSQTTTKPVAQTIPFSSVPTSIITSTPVSSGLAAPSRINILNSTIITPSNVVSSIPQRIVLPNIVKSSPVKISPTKAAVKSTPIKPIPIKTSTNSKASRKSNIRIQNGNDSSDQNLNLDSPYSPGSSDYEDLFEPPTEVLGLKQSAKQITKKSPAKAPNVFDSLFGSSPFQKVKSKDFIKNTTKSGKKGVSLGGGKGTKQVGVKIDEDNLKILDDLPNSAVEMQVKDKFLKKLNRQERVVEEVKLVLKPHYNKKHVNKDEYKDILRRAVPKICHNKSGEINPTKIKNLIEAYVKKIRHSKKVTSSSSVNPQKA